MIHATYFAFNTSFNMNKLQSNDDEIFVEMLKKNV